MNSTSPLLEAGNTRTEWEKSDAVETGSLDGREFRRLFVDPESLTTESSDDSYLIERAGRGRGSGAFRFGVGAAYCLMLAVGAVMWGAGSVNCDEPTFKGWGDVACNIQNVGAIMTITSGGIAGINAAICCLCCAILCPVFCCVASENGF
jgi:hypothetical protein